MRQLIPAAALLCGWAASVYAQEQADAIWTGGPILTMEDDTPRAEAVAVKNGVILAIGSLQDVSSFEGENTIQIDLDGKTLLPGFVDAHGHVFLIGLQALVANMQAPPDGEISDIPAMQRVLSAWMREHPGRVDSFGMVMGFGYDDAQLAEQRHPTRDALDEVVDDKPAMVIHQSGHLATLNSKALEISGYSSETPDPAGGVIRRRVGSQEPNGVLEETAFFGALGQLARSVDPLVTPMLFKAGVDLVTSYGYTTAQEGRTNPSIVRLMQATAADPNMDIPIDVVAYIDVLVDRDIALQEHSTTYKDRIRIGGYKLTIDGSPQGFTALRDRPYYDPPSQYRRDYLGYAAADSDTVFDAIDFAFANNVQIITHANGEGAMDIHIAAIQAATENHGIADRRSVLIHGQFVREDQIDSYNRLDVFPSLFPMHTFYWGDWHRDRTVGPEKADNISPTGWLVERGMMFSSHHDAPVAFPDSMRILDATVTRRSRSGDIIGPEHRVDVMTALKAMTIWPAYQHFEEDRKGSLKVGKLADFVVLSEDPTAVDPETLDQLKVLQTIKEGRVIYQRP
ncbi:MAG: amidohydrolase [Pseudomonadota bacterium]